MSFQRKHFLKTLFENKNNNNFHILFIFSGFFYSVEFENIILMCFLNTVRVLFSQKLVLKIVSPPWFLGFLTSFENRKQKQKQNRTRQLILALIFYLHFVYQLFCRICWNHNVSCWTLYETFFHSFIKQCKQAIVIPIHIQQPHLFKNPN